MPRLAFDSKVVSIRINVDALSICFPVSRQSTRRELDGLHLKTSSKRFGTVQDGVRNTRGRSEGKTNVSDITGIFPAAFAGVC